MIQVPVYWVIICLINILFTTYLMFEKNIVVASIYYVSTSFALKHLFIKLYG